MIDLIFFNLFTIKGPFYTINQHCVCWHADVGTESCPVEGAVWFVIAESQVVRREVYDF